MQGGSLVQQQLEGLNYRFDNGVGKGVQYYKAQLKKKRAANGKIRTVMFCKEDEPGTAIPDYDQLSPTSPKRKNLSPLKELEKRYENY